MCNKSSDVVSTTNKTGAIIVSYNSDTRVLSQVLKVLVPELSATYVVDNSDESALAREIEEVSTGLGARYVGLNGNKGIAVAQNAGIRRAIMTGAANVLLLDDDSHIDPQSLRRLIANFESVRERDPRVIAAGPLITDTRTESRLAYVWSRNKIVRVSQSASITEPIEVAFLVSSGSIVDVEALESVGFFQEKYFIDHVDKEWGLRVASQGMKMVVFPDVEMRHALGEPVGTNNSRALPFGHTNPVRDYYLTRNAFFLLRDVKISCGRRFSLGMSTVKYTLYKLVFPSMGGQRKMVLRGIFDGVRGRGGKLAVNS